MEDVNMQQISIKFVPQMLSDKQKQWCVFVCQELLDEVRNNKNFLLRVITGDKTWFYCNNPETKEQYSQWKKAHPPHA
jgi:hypothetical protein